MKKNVLESKMKLYGDTQPTLAEFMGISVQTFCRKVNGKDGSEFNQSEIQKIRERYNLTDQEVVDIFFGHNVS
jgi:hypothetical protein